MPLIAKRFTLASHAKTVAIVPIAVPLAKLAMLAAHVPFMTGLLRFVVRRWWLVAIAIMTVLAVSAVRGWRPKALDPATSFALIATPVVLCAVSLLLTIYDQFRYRGWELDGSKDLDSLSRQFATALIGGNVQRASELCSFPLRGDLTTSAWAKASRCCWATWTIA
jgi:hypothetical protein